MLSFLDFYAVACPKGPFWLSFRLLFESPGLFKKQLKVCNCRRFSRCGPFRMRFFKRFDRGFVLTLIFFQIFCFLLIFGVSNLIDFRSKIATRKKSEKRVNDEFREKWKLGVWALKREQNTQLWQLTTRETAQARPACLAARWRIVKVRWKLSKWGRILHECKLDAHRALIYFAHKLACSFHNEFHVHVRKCKNACMNSW